MAPINNELIVEIDGGDVAPGNVDAPKMLSMAAAYLTLLQRVAHEFYGELEATGLEIRDKCVAIVTHASDLAAAERATRDIVAYLKDEMEPPRGCREDAKRLGEALRNLPNQQGARVLGGGSAWQIDLHAPPETAERPANELWSVRATLERIGGTKNTRVGFRSDLDGLPFTLSTTKETARRIAPHLYRSLEIEAEIIRTSTGRITGKLLTFEPVEEASTETNLSDWRRWFQDNASELDSVPFEELEVALGRSED